ncbi:MAG: S8 family serine peptidase [Vicinamibacterales bacterium]
MRVNGKSFFRMSGTSMAAPVVSGIVADMLQAADMNGVRLTPNVVKAMLQVLGDCTRARRPAHAGRWSGECRRRDYTGRFHPSGYARR